MEALKKLYDFRELNLPEQLFQLSWSEEEVEKALEDVRVRFLTIEETAGPVQAGDFVAIDLPTTDREDARRVQINVGKRFYDTAFEDTLIGLVPGAPVSMPDRDHGRAGTLVQIKRRLLPELTDALIARMEIEGVDTMDAYREYQQQRLIVRDKRKKANALFSMVLQEVVKCSEFGDMTAEIEEELRLMLVQLRTYAEQEGMSYEEYLADRVPSEYETTKQREDYLRPHAETQARQRLVAGRFLEQSGQQPSREGYEAEKQRYLDMGLDRAQIESRFNYDAYVQNLPFQVFQDAVLSYYENKFKVVTKK